MLSYYEHELIREPRPDDGVRCFRCNTPLSASLALRREGLCTACAEGKTVQFHQTPERTPYDPVPRQKRRGTALAEWARELAQMAPPLHWLRSRGQAKEV